MTTSGQENIVSAYSIVKGAMIPETYAAMAAWNFRHSKRENLCPLKGKSNACTGSYSNLRENARVLEKRFDPAGADRALVTLAKSGFDLEEWKPLLLWHLSRDEFLLRDFLIHWLFPTCYGSRAHQVKQEDLHFYFMNVGKRGGKIEHPWTASTLSRVATSLLKLVADFGLLTGSNRVRQFVSYQLPERSFLYLLHALSEKYDRAQKVVNAPDWRIFLLLPTDVERELLRLHREGKLTYEGCGPSARLALPYRSAHEYAEKMSEPIPGERCEVDYAGERIEWLDPRTGSIHRAHVFVGVLCFSRLTFAWASEEERGSSWLDAHRKMFEAFGGVPRTVVCGNLKQGVIKPHRYDPKSNPGYAEIAGHYMTSVISVRPDFPHDRAHIAKAKEMVMRAFRLTHGRHTFTSIAEVNHALAHVVNRVNRKTRPGTGASRIERWAKQESLALRPLPEVAFEAVEWKLARVHADSTISLESAYYTVPHQHRSKTVRVKLTATHIQVFKDLESVALHERDFARRAIRHVMPEHLLDNAEAYSEPLPQKLLSQACEVAESFHMVIERLFAADTLGNLRRVQRLVRHANDEIRKYGRNVAQPRIEEAVEQMIRNDNFRVHYFEGILHQLRQNPSRKGGHSLVGGVENIRPGSRLVLSGFQTDYRRRGEENLKALDALVDELIKRSEMPTVLDVDHALQLLALAHANLIFEDEFQDHRAVHEAALEHLSRTARDLNLRDKVVVIVARDRNVSRYREEGRLSNSPDTKQQKEKAAEVARDGPVLMLLRQNGEEAKGWKGLPFWWPVIVTPATGIGPIEAS